MTRSNQKIVQYLDEAHASEVGLVRVLQSQIAMTPRGTYRTALEHHLGETRDHARRIEARLGELGHGGNPIQAGIGVAETVFAQGLAVGKTPFDLLRGSGGEEKVLKNAKDAAATEALEIATYTAIERLARDVGDEETARLAASIRATRSGCSTRVLEEIPKLTDAVVGSDVRGRGSYDVAKTGAADAPGQPRARPPRRRSGRPARRGAPRAMSRGAATTSRPSTRSARSSTRPTTRPSRPWRTTSARTSTASACSRPRSANRPARRKAAHGARR